VVNYTERRGHSLIKVSLTCVKNVRLSALKLEFSQIAKGSILRVKYICSITVQDMYLEKKGSLL